MNKTEDLKNTSKQQTQSSNQVEKQKIKDEPKQQSPVVNNNVIVPRLIGLTETNAVNKLKSLGLNYSVIKEMTEGTSGTVFEQSVSVGRSVKKGTSIKLYVVE